MEAKELFSQADAVEYNVDKNGKLFVMEVLAGQRVVSSLWIDEKVWLHQ